MMEEEIFKELKDIKEELRYIRTHMIDTDMILTLEEEKIIKESIEEFEKGKTIKLEDLEKR